MARRLQRVSGWASFSTPRADTAAFFFPAPANRLALAGTCSDSSIGSVLIL